MLGVATSVLGIGEAASEIVRDSMAEVPAQVAAGGLQAWAVHAVEWAAAAAEAVAVVVAVAGNQIVTLQKACADCWTE